MTRDEAAKILGISPTAKPREINRTFTDLRRQYATRSQFSTQPNERDAAARALKFLQEAYREMTGATTADVPLRRRRAPSASSPIPRKRIIGRQASQPTPARRTRLKVRIVWLFPWQSLMPRDEKTAAVAICAAMFVIALIVVACI